MSFNDKIEKLERLKLFKRHSRRPPNVIIKFDEMKSGCNPDGTLFIAGKINSKLRRYKEDEVDAFVLTFRIVTQNNDALSVGNLAKLYEDSRVPVEAKDNFADARKQLNDYMDSPILVQFGDRYVTNRQVIDIFVYGGLAHSNKRKQVIYEAWIGNPAICGLMQAEFIGALIEVMRYLSFFKALNVCLIESFRAQENCT